MSLREEWNTKCINSYNVNNLKSTLSQQWNAMSIFNMCFRTYRGLHMFLLYVTAFVKEYFWTHGVELLLPLPWLPPTNVHLWLHLIGWMLSLMGCLLLDFKQTEHGDMFWKLSLVCQKQVTKIFSEKHFRLEIGHAVAQSIFVSIDQG